MCRLIVCGCPVMLLRSRPSVVLLFLSSRQRKRPMPFLNWILSMMVQICRWSQSKDAIYLSRIKFLFSLFVLIALQHWYTCNFILLVLTSHYFPNNSVAIIDFPKGFLQYASCSYLKHCSVLCMHMHLQCFYVYMV